MSAVVQHDLNPDPITAIRDGSPASMMLAAVNKGIPLEQLEKMMELQERWEANEARKAYNTAFAAFKDEAIRIIKNREVNAGPLSGKKYAELFAVVNAVTPALSKHGLSASWRITKDEKDWIEVTCTIKHISGHSESVAMGGPPDEGGAKNKIQARASTVSYLERYTLKAITGLSEQEDDKDGNQPPAADIPEKLLADAETAAEGGTAAYAAWFAKLSKEERKSLAPEHERIKREAAKHTQVDA